MLTALEPLTLAPVITVALGEGVRASAAENVDLNNVGAVMLSVLGLDGGKRFTIVVLGVLAYVAVVAASSGLDLMTARRLRQLRLAIAADVQARVHAHFMSLPLPFLARSRLGELTSRLVHDVVLAVQTLEVAVRWTAESVALLAIYGYLLASTDGTLAASIGAIALIHLVLTRILETGTRSAAVEGAGAVADVAASAMESLSQARTARSFAAEELFQKRFLGTLATFQRKALRQFLLVDSEIPLRRVANALGVGVAVVLSFLALSSGRLTLPGFVLFVFVSRQMIQPLSLLGRAFLQAQTFLGASLRLRELLDIKPAVKDGTREPSPLREAIEFRRACFGYSREAGLLHDISLRLPRGTVVAIVGPSGAGKSTLADLLLRLHDPTSGSVTYDGVDLKQFVQASYRRRFGVVAEEPLLIHASVEENIVYGRPFVREEVERAARIANADEFISRLPEGYATLVGERGARLSRGERQRISIARAVYGRPEVLVLDEATSALDSESERMVQNAIDRALSGTTAMVIAHRLSTVLKADNIVVLENGRIVASGRHAELLERSALYRRLYTAQQAEGKTDPSQAQTALA